MRTPLKIGLLKQCTLLCLLIGISDARPVECKLYRRSLPACKCLKAEDSNEGIIDCSGLNLTSVPTAVKPISGTIYEMRLNNNNIVSLTTTSFAGLKIRKLDLRGNKISTVEDGTFQGLAPTTTILYIDGNGTSSPPSGALNKLVNLRELTMRNYGTTILLADLAMFITFSGLNSLTLENWKLESINTRSLQGPLHLTSLTLNKHEFAALPINLLHDTVTKTLKRLTISNTKIKEVTDHAFEKLTNLEELDLSRNVIYKLESSCFEGLANSLRSLNLSGNALGVDPNVANDLRGLRNLPNLNLLDLSSNEFKGSFPSVSQLNSAVRLHTIYRK